MNEANHENLSAMSDGELALDQVRFMLRQLDHDAHLRATWSRYHISRDCVRGEFAALASDGFADRVMAALDAAAPAAPRHDRRRWMYWSAGGAIAASVAAMALMVAQPRGPASVPMNSSSMIASSTSSAAAGGSAHAVARAPEVPRWLAAPSAGRLAQPAAASTFDGQVLGNNALIPAAYSRGMAPYMTLRDWQSQNRGMRVRGMPPGGWIIQRMPAANQPSAQHRSH
jgi:sigma-E factor negative regulatory protein RseA